MGRLVTARCGMKVWRGGKKTHASSPSTSGKTHEKTCPIQTRRETRDTREEEKSSIQQQQFVMKRSLLIHGLSLACFSFRSCNVEVVEEESQTCLRILLRLLEMRFISLGSAINWFSDTWFTRQDVRRMDSRDSRGLKHNPVLIGRRLWKRETNEEVDGVRKEKERLTAALAKESLSDRLSLHKIKLEIAIRKVYEKEKGKWWEIMKVNSCPKIGNQRAVLVL